VRECINCGLPEGKFDVKLNSNYICNYCTYFDQNKKQILDYSSRKHLLISRFNKFKGAYDYDVVVGLSGGKDSTYVLYKLVNEYKLNVLAITYDNGFLTDFAIKSIKKTIKKIGVPHIYYKPNKKILGKFYNAAINTFGDPCIACALGGYFLSIKVCYNLKIPFFIHGRSPYQMYRNYYKESKDLFLALLNLNLQEHSFKKIAQIYLEVHQKLKYYIENIVKNVNDAKEIISEFFIDSNKIQKDFIPEFLSFFAFHEYNEEMIKSDLEETIGWVKHKNDQLLGHYDCTIHDAAGFIYKEIHGINVLVPDLAVMRRFGKISRRDAECLLTSNKLSKRDVNKSLNCLCEICKSGRNDILKSVDILRKKNIDKFHSF